MMDVIGPHNSLYIRDGVIQFNIMLKACIAMATYAVQPVQFSASPADVMLAPICEWFYLQMTVVNLRLSAVI